MLAGKRQVLLDGMEEQQWVAVSRRVVVATIRRRWDRQAADETKGRNWIWGRSGTLSLVVDLFVNTFKISLRIHRHSWVGRERELCIGCTICVSR